MINLDLKFQITYNRLIKFIEISLDVKLFNDLFHQHHKKVFAILLKLLLFNLDEESEYFEDLGKCDDLNSSISSFLNQILYYLIHQKFQFRNPHWLIEKLRELLIRFIPNHMSNHFLIYLKVKFIRKIFFTCLSQIFE